MVWAQKDADLSDQSVHKIKVTILQIYTKTREESCMLLSVCVFLFVSDGLNIFGDIEPIFQT